VDFAERGRLDVVLGVAGETAFIHQDSCECTKSELDLFSTPPTQASADNGTFVEYHPISSLADGTPIEFEVSSSGEDYIDFANSPTISISKMMPERWTRLIRMLTTKMMDLQRELHTHR
jgi:hypothetical protein